MPPKGNSFSVEQPAFSVEESGIFSQLSLRVRRRHRRSARVLKKSAPAFKAGADFCYPIMRLNFWRKSAFAHSKNQAISRLCGVS